jgi:agmatine deiminase
VETDFRWSTGVLEPADGFVAFLDERTVALAWVDESERDANPVKQINFDRMSENLRILQASTDEDGNPFEIVKIPLPDLQYEEFELPPSNLPAFREVDPSAKVGDTIRWVATSSYLNYVITNGVLLLPRFWEPGMSEPQRAKDQTVLEIFQSYYPDRKIVQINPLTLNHLGGGMHCLIQTPPSLAE